MSALATRLSTKGQLILPKAIRQARQWEAGTRLLVEEHEDGVLLKAAPWFAPTTIEETFGCLPYEGEPLTLDQMDAAIVAEARRVAGK
ncbi:AbrB/MazE/SpoVT family DNA-binding domain-containing protein [Sandaracinobacteroides saxicola]|uniref:AbrB/MazE/SpoVT family DNA-binding domain-containing protein n=1 Tax=Sandaracinobacteroides saxicola TaxID=2759707 RepID=A0A7G5IIF6_9SPHN|nr:AbrB/MazE/SpoVT family DNA-binding domain-containing protein [Sandaracinobacteroides saxicola]QMW23148.1 AbrB/MazE/SpoVT family DNA-binding domain-containing protein [Sandaracinobacteroides saxicola]